MVLRHVDLDQQLRGTLQKRLEEFEHAQVGGLAKQAVVRFLPLFLVQGISQVPDHFEATFE